MNMPGFTADKSIYRTNNHYCQFAGDGNFLNAGNSIVIPQSCGWIKGSLCAGFIAGGVAICTASCIVGAAAGGIPCLACWAGLGIGTGSLCYDCILGWMRSLIDLAEGGGGNPTGGCPRGTKCCGGFTKIPGVGLVCNGVCVGRFQRCPGDGPDEFFLER